MAKKKKEVLEERIEEPVEEKPLPVLEPKATEPRILKALVKDRETLMKLQRERKLINYDPKTGEVVYRED